VPAHATTLTIEKMIAGFQHPEGPGARESDQIHSVPALPGTRQRLGRENAVLASAVALCSACSPWKRFGSGDLRGLQSRLAPG
jgi:hypothetical protein